MRKKVEYGEDPQQPWNMDTYNYYYFSDKGAICQRPLTNKAKGMKENIYEYQLKTADNHLLTVLSRERQSGMQNEQDVG